MRILEAAGEGNPPVSWKTTLAALRLAGHTLGSSPALGPDVILSWDDRGLRKALSSLPGVPVVRYLPGSQRIPAVLPGRKTLAVFHCTSEALEYDGRTAVIPPVVVIPPEGSLEVLGGNTILCPGPFSRSAGHRTLFKAVALLSADLRIVIAGEEDDCNADYILRTAEETGVAGRTEMRNGGGCIRALLGAAPSLTGERGHLTAGVLMAGGTPVLASSAGCHRELVIDGFTGLYHSPGNHRQLASQMEHLMHDQGLRCYLSANASDHCARELSPEAVGRRWTALLEQLCHG